MTFFAPQKSLKKIIFFSLVFLGAGLSIIQAQDISKEAVESLEHNAAKLEETTGAEASEVKSAKKKRKKKKAKKNVSAATSEVEELYSATEVAKNSFRWVPSSAPYTLQTEILGANAKPVSQASLTVQQVNPPEELKKRYSFKLPQIPFTQVLIVATCVILFLIYRIRVNRQMRKKNY